MRKRPGSRVAVLVCAIVLILGCTEQDGPPSELVVHTTLRPPNQDVYLVDRPGAEPRRVTEHPALDYDATFSPDGRWLVFTSDRSGNPDLWARDLEEGGEPVRLTRHPALDDAADVSPDGERVVFVSNRDGKTDVWTMPFEPGDTTAEARARNLTDSPADDFNPAFSPDGSRIAWARRTGPLRPPDLLLTRVFVMEADGSGARPMTDDGRMIAGAPSWSRDGDAVHAHGIAYGGEFERLIRLRAEGWTSRIWRVPADGGDPAPVTPADSFLALSPAPAPGGRVAYVRARRPPSGAAPLYRRTGAVRTADPEGADRRRAHDAGGLSACLAPAYDRDGRLVCHGPGPTDGMAIMDNGRPFLRPGTHQTVSLPDRELRVRGIRGYFPDFLPDGRLVYGEWLNDEADMAEYGMPPLVTSRPDGSDRRVVFHETDRQPWAPSACGDGSWIAFNEGPTFAPVDEDVDVWKVRPDGTGAVNLTPDSDANDAFPAWSPDCRTIVFRSGRDGDKEIYRMDADGGNVRRLTHRGGVETVPDVSPDGEWIAFATDRDGAGMKIWLQRLDGGDGRFLEPDREGEPGIDMHPRFSPDGRWVAFVSDRGGIGDEFLLTDAPQPYGDIWAAPVEGGEAVRLTDDRWEDGLPRWGRLPDR
jgi:Tol biopolymer transport system component